MTTTEKLNRILSFLRVEHSKAKTEYDHETLYLRIGGRRNGALEKLSTIEYIMEETERISRL